MHKGDIAAAKTVLADVVNNGTTSSGAAYGLEDDLDNNFNALTENVKRLFSLFNILLLTKTLVVLLSV